MRRNYKQNLVPVGCGDVKPLGTMGNCSCRNVRITVMNECGNWNKVMVVVSTTYSGKSNYMRNENTNGENKLKHVKNTFKMLIIICGIALVIMGLRTNDLKLIIFTLGLPLALTVIWYGTNGKNIWKI